MITNTWVKDLIKKNPDITFNDILLPGTHNSCSYKFDSNLINLSHSNILNCCIITYFIKNWTVNQCFNIYNQLKIGVRVFNIDVSYYNKDFYTSHRFCINKLETDLKQIQDYSNEFNEFIVLSFILQNIPSNQIENLEKLIKSYFDNNTIYPMHYVNPLNVSLSEFSNNNKNILIYFEKESNYHVFYSHKLMYCSSWENETSITQLKEKCNHRLIHFNNLKKNHIDIFCDLNWTLTPKSNQIIKSIFCCNKYNNLEEWITPLNKELTAFLHNNKDNLKKINSISIDFAYNYIIEQIINLHK
tara:strand:- start:62 stop:964 length:903 start_codon:yes stop_codon:yes gene_type:complete